MENKGASPENSSNPNKKRRLTFSFREKEFEYSNLKGKSFSNDYPYKKAKHPFLCRLKESAGFTVTSQMSLIGAGFASLGMGLFTLFRPTPLLLYSVIFKMKNIPLMSKTLSLVLLFSWHGIIVFVLFFLGLFLTLSTKIKKRWVLMLHPWGLLLLYFDVFVWMCVTASIHLEMERSEELSAWFSQKFNPPFVFFVIIYIECFCFCLLSYLYATYFIVAELTTIERFF